MSLAHRAAIAAALLAPVVAAQAAEYATVVSSTPVTAQVTVPRQACNNEQRLVQPQPSGAGAIIGAIAGGVIGNQFGAGMGRAAATGLGAVAGSVIGNQVEANGNPPSEVTVQRCQTVGAYETRTVGYDVVYEYAGHRYTTRLANDPGTQLAINVNPAGSPVPPAPSAAPVYAPGYAVAAPVYAPGPAVVVAPYVGYGYGYGWRARRWYW
jgi:uncharacterized protein YcfJ